MDFIAENNNNNNNNKGLVYKQEVHINYAFIYFYFSCIKCLFFLKTKNKKKVNKASQFLFFDSHCASCNLMLFFLCHPYQFLAQTMS